MLWRVYKRDMFCVRPCICPFVSDGSHWTDFRVNLDMEHFYENLSGNCRIA